jgi:hypothetical protein
VLHISDQHQSNPHGIVDLILSGKNRFRLTPDQKLTVVLSDDQKTGLLTQTKYILKEIAQHVNA